MNDSERTAKARERALLMNQLERAKEFAAQNVEDEWTDEIVVEFALSERFSAIKEAREECCRAVCDCCGKYAQYWNPAELVNERWRHISKKVPDEGKPTTHLCDAAAIRILGER